MKINYNEDHYDRLEEIIQSWSLDKAQYDASKAAALTQKPVQYLSQLHDNEELEAKDMAGDEQHRTVDKHTS